MAKKKFPFILIKDAKNGFRTQLVGGNGELLMTSEVLESAKAVEKNLFAVELATANKNWKHEMNKQDIRNDCLLNDIRYTGKSKAIYKMFKISKES